jgi:transposase
MTQQERDRLVVLKKALKKLIKQSQAAKELGLTARQVRRLVRRLKAEGDQVVIHGLRGRPSHRRISAEDREEIIRILSQEVYRGFGPTLASEYLAKKHDIEIGREALRQILMAAGLWRARGQKVEKVHQWRPRRSCRGELVQWDTSEHDWLEGRGEKLYLIHMIDDATSELTARFVRHDSTEENMRLLWIYVDRHGRPVAFYTDKASLFQTAPKVARDVKELPRDERDPLPPTQIGRALRELGIAWIPAHSPQAKGRVERSFQTAQDRLVKGLRVAGARTLEEANRYLEEEFLPWWNQHLVMAPANPADAHRPLGVTHDLAASLCYVESREVDNDYTIRLDGKRYRIVSNAMPAGLRGSVVRVERRLEGSLHVRFRERYYSLAECPSPSKPVAKVQPEKKAKPNSKPPAPSNAYRESMRNFLQKKLSAPMWQAVADRTRTRDVLD